MRRTKLAAAVALLIQAMPAAADDIGNKLSSYEQEVSGFGVDLAIPRGTASGADGNRLPDAQVAFSLGDYDRAALILFDLLGQSTLPPEDKDKATYYLGETLFQKGDKGAAHEYFSALVGGTRGKFYELALVRLVEIAIAQRDSAGGADALSKLEAIPGYSAAVPYVKGKLAFSDARYDDATAAFGQVPKGSEWELQALYFSATTQIAKKDLAKATDIFTDLISRKPKTAADRRVIELGQLALGRLYYEREQPAKSIDAYLLLDRHSDLFSDALYEVAWVYVKSKQYDKALQTLQLIDRAEPSAEKTATARILEGNLRIRKAQSIRLAQVNGQLLPEGAGDPAVEYDRAARTFQETHDLYLPSYQALSALVDGDLDAAAFVEQLAGRSQHVFTATAPIPDAAAQSLREHPDVQQIAGVETDLAVAKNDIAESEAMIARLDGVLSSGDRTAVFPQLAMRRTRVSAIEDDLIAIRSQLADRELGLAKNGSNVAQLTAARKDLVARHATLRAAEKAHADRISAAHAELSRIDTEANEVSQAIDSTQAIAVAMRRYAVSPNATPPLSDAVKSQIDTTLVAAAKEAEVIDNELASIRREIVLGKDLAGVDGNDLAQLRELRKQLKAAQDAEQRAISSSAGGGDRNEFNSLMALSDRATRLADSLYGVDQTIDQAIAQGLEQVKQQLAQERGLLASYKQQLADYESQGRTVGAAALASSVKDVRSKFYDVLVRADVGGVDVAWSQKQATDDDLKRLNLSRNRELRQLQDEFKDVLEDSTPKPRSNKSAPEAPPAEGPPQSTSPDKATAPDDNRIRPVEQTTTDSKPALKPGTSTAPKTGGKK